MTWKNVRACVCDESQRGIGVEFIMNGCQIFFFYSCFIYISQLYELRIIVLSKTKHPDQHSTGGNSPEKVEKLAKLQ